MKFEMLSQGDIDQIHDATFRVLERTGTRVCSERARKMLAEAGCTLDGDLVHIPRKLVEQSLASAPEGFTFYDRNGNPACRIEGRNSYFGTGVMNPNFHDLDTDQRRPTRVSDIEDAARVADALENIEWIMPLGSAQDVPAHVSDVYEFQAAVTNTTKPIIFICHDTAGVEDVLNMAETIVGGRDQLREKPFLISYPEPISPLIHIEEALDKLFLSAERGIPIVYTPAPMMGATAPVTIAGVLVQTNAECLTGLVLSQITSPGTPFIVGGVLSPMDMSTTSISYGAPELSLALAGYADIAHHYGLPTYGTAGCSDSKLPDEQAAIEATFSSFANALAGLNLIHDPGFLEAAMIGSLEMLVMTDEIAGMVKRFMRGIPVNAETLAEDVIADIGPGGHYLRHDHTLKHFRQELWRPTLMDRQNFHAWQESGSKTMGQRIKEKVRDILNSHQPQQLDDSTIATLCKIRTESEKRRRLQS